MKYIKIIVVSVALLLIPLLVHGQVRITEIMYDPAGADTKREWIEVYNAGTTSVDLSTYFFLENNVYHRLVAQGQAVLGVGEFAIIADSVAEVVAEYTSFMGKIFDSAFSLNNTGETISMTDSTKQITHTVTYDSTMGANNDGNSLQINGDTIISASPTFGLSNETEPTPPVDTGSGTSSTTTGGTTSGGTGASSHSQQQGLGSYTQTTPFKIGAGRDRIVSINTPIEFIAQISKSDINPRLIWNLGDFKTDKGKKIKHIYTYPGSYEVVLEGRADGQTAITRTQVTVVEPDLEFIYATSTFGIKNSSKKEINIGEFRFVFAQGKDFVVPVNTIIKAGAIIYKDLTEGQIVREFVYPNGKVYKKFDTIEG